MSADSGMALGILIAMIIMLSIPGTVFGVIGWFIGRKTEKGAVYGCGGFVLGVALGILGVMFTFYWEDAFEPELHVVLPSGFAHDSVFVLEDPSVSNRIQWNSMHTEATLVVPPNGVVRVATLEDFSTWMLDAERNGVSSNSASGRPAPPSLAPAVTIKCIGFGATRDCERDDMDALILEREARP